MAAIILVSAIKWIGGRHFLRYRSEGTGTKRWTMFSVLDAPGTGALWGVLATAMFPALESYQLFLAFVVGGMCADGITVSGVHFPTAVAFVVPASLPLAASFLAEGPASGSRR